MMNDNFFQVFLDQPFIDKESIQRFIAEFANEAEAEELIALLKQREKVGNTMIAEHVILPHLESPKIKQSQVLLIRLADPLDFDEKTPEVKLIIAILLKSDESQEIKKQIAQFTRRLADDEFLEKLLIAENEAHFYQLLAENN
ncbi:PTS sugar transporter subunit IIA [Enterococcus raffinosus]|uniref:PTS sugar transporter subunit IIA n=1 Tax=Enterococcus raffinosus TaxID=71452 RepID=UPI001C448C52|nr:PTS sugar transporter subunit IIA [Enterococcus raffinosus]MDT2571448.1 PTS sugar transporter subunit IIA [Enterococcus raffinosus]QXJ59125.1 PTS sugar transporter subunit IIA [Enterococcus raffinosus]